MVLPSRTTLAAGVASAVVLSVPVFFCGALRAEERINWLKSNGSIARNWPTRKSKPIAPSAVELTPTTQQISPPPLPTVPNCCRRLIAIAWLPGDRLVTSVFKIEGYEAQVQVLSDGTINLPRLGTVAVWGLTLKKLVSGLPLATANFYVAPCLSRSCCRATSGSGHGYGASFAPRCLYSSSQQSGFIGISSDANRRS